MENNEQLDLAAQVEAILFFTAEPLSYRKLAGLLKVDVPTVREATKALRERLLNSGGGVRLLEQEGEVALGTAAQASALIEQITRDEISKELSKASLETLAIICYKGPLTRSDIDYIRGVNSTFILRNLLVRGIVEKLENPRDARASLYGATFAALEFMGVTRKEDLPQYEEIQTQLAAFAASRTEEGTKPEEGEQDKERPLEEEASEMGDSETVADYSNAEAAFDDSGDSTPELCDDDGDGAMTAEECAVPFQHPLAAEEEGPLQTAVEADISEENLMNSAFDDDAIAVHNAVDEAAEELAEHEHES